MIAIASLWKHNIYKTHSDWEATLHLFGQNFTQHHLATLLFHNKIKLIPMH